MQCNHPAQEPTRSHNKSAAADIGIGFGPSLRGLSGRHEPVETEQRRRVAHWTGIHLPLLLLLLLLPCSLGRMKILSTTRHLDVRLARIKRSCQQRPLVSGMQRWKLSPQKKSFAAVLLLPCAVHVCVLLCRGRHTGFMGITPPPPGRMLLVAPNCGSSQAVGASSVGSSAEGTGPAAAIRAESP